MLHSTNINGIPPRKLTLKKGVPMATRESSHSVYARNSFPVVPAFGMIINTAQGQTVQNLLLNLASPCFSHGQLYVALSRDTSRSKFKALIEYPKLEEDDGVYTDNIMYRQIFDTN
ncbi:unnamed protein product [Phytophthora fragariaefolia]|uniref:Unnamed protein product n=1 Tax=Phytophthora fragariaefolia TaxID=1490495 RepID=A0A9W6YR53_9STRA|nr:unnamed protein product [Phytophthora fragariaefolia]